MMRKPGAVGVLEAPAASNSLSKTAMAYVELTKPRIMLLLLYTGICGMFVAAEGLPSLRVVILTIIGLALSTGGSAALNMWYDRDIDPVMKRTSSRPIPRGAVQPQGALIFGIILVVLSFVELALFVNVMTGVLAVLGAFYYVGIYTMWLKRRTPQNIVIGGGAGAFPPLIGATAITGHIGLAAVVLFLIVFMWTPPHFWSLAVFKNEEYRKVNLPMLPVVRGIKTTKVQSLVYGVLLLVTSMALPFVTKLSLIYIPVALVLNGVFLYYLGRSLAEKDSDVYAHKSFFFSIAYLFILFLVIAVASIV